MLKKIGIILIAGTLLVGAFTYYRGLLFTRRPLSKITAHTEAKANDGTIVDTTTLVGHRAEIRWSVALPLASCFLVGIACVSFGKQRK